MTNKLKYGIIGAGHLGNYHAQQLNNINGVKLIGVFDLEQEKAEEFSKIYSIKHYAALKNLLTACDAVSITTPASAHFESARLALLAGCHIFVEKPFTHKIDEAKNFAVKPIKITLPQVKNKVELKPIIRSVITKLISTTGMYLIPNSTGV